MNIEPLEKAIHDLGFAVENLQEFNSTASPLESFAVLPLIGKAQTLCHEVNALLNAVEYDIPETEHFWKIENCPDGVKNFKELMRMIAAGDHDIDIDDFVQRLDLPEGWDWGDIEDRIQRGHWTAEFIDATIHRGLIG